ncbi:MAG: hypothetical protein HC847_27575 [Hydrococcus sp. RU_2_2]|nr:hypothetical protein [Hydrococcus sp. RU_2_2]NJP22224.1 hypothetical protein [Hydrococcus sp. CRU_1_1]
MSKHDIKKGDRVTWTDYKSDRPVKGQVLKVFRNGRAQVLSADFEKFNIELSRLSVHSRQVALIEMPEIEEEPIRHWETDADGIDLPPNNLPPNNLPPNNLPPNSWIESKEIRGQTYQYARWREEVEVNGIKKVVKRSRYLEKVTSSANN